MNSYLPRRISLPRPHPLSLSLSLATLLYIKADVANINRSSILPASLSLSRVNFTKHRFYGHRYAIENTSSKRVQTVIVFYLRQLVCLILCLPDRRAKHWIASAAQPASLL